MQVTSAVFLVAALYCCLLEGCAVAGASPRLTSISAIGSAAVQRGEGAEIPCGWSILYRAAITSIAAGPIVLALPTVEAYLLALCWLPTVYRGGSATWRVAIIVSLAQSLPLAPSPSTPTLC